MEERRQTVFKNQVLGRIFGTTRGSRERRICLHNEVFRIYYSPPNIIMEINSSKNGWAGHAARKKE
jgi:hypothetical protein